MPQDLESELKHLHSMSFVELKAAWLKRLGQRPKHISVDLMRRRLAYIIQADTLGAMKSSTQRRLGQLDAAFRADPRYSPSADYILTPGTVLVRLWRGKRHKVQVLEHGFSYGGRPYGSLSEIATAITGARWSGPAFFGLRRSGS